MRLIQQILTGFVLLTTISASAQTPLAIGASYPKGALKMKAVSEKLISLDDARGAKGLLVIFISNTCPHNVRSQSRLNDLARTAKESSIGVLLLNANENLRNNDESLAAMSTYASGNGVNCEYLVDSNNELADALGATRTPECFLFNAEGKLVFHGSTEEKPADTANGGEAYAQQAISQLAAGKPVNPSESRLIGCSIKRKK
jgi:Redoxin